jgi:hypothetical protein
MAIVNTEEELLKIIKNENKDFPITLPLMVQQVIKHSGVLYKCYAIGDFTHVFKKVSLRDFDENGFFLKLFKLIFYLF